MPDRLPESAEIVIVGGGVIGCSTAYHLAKEGKREVVLLERAELTCGTTWHSAAMVRQLRSTISLTRLTQYSAQLYRELEAETGLSTGWIGCGSLSIANNRDRLTHIRRQASLARAFGIDVTEIGSDEITKLWPIARTDDIIAAVLSPSDGRVSASDLCASLIKGAKKAGVRIIEHTPVDGFQVMNGRITGVETASGNISCEQVALCSGLWSRNLANAVGVNVPLYPCEHYALITKPFEGIYPGMPIMGDHDGNMYIRDEAGGLMVGCFEPNARPVDFRDLPDNFAFDLLAEDWDQFEPIMEGAIHRIPELEHAEVRTLLNGPESFTPDNSFLLGEAPELEGFFMCCGMNSVGMASGGGAGRALAEWMVNGEPTTDLSSVDVRRNAAVRNTVKIVRERAAETLASHYLLSQPGREPRTGRNARLTPFYDRHAAKGAFFGERAGWERPSWFARDGRSVENELTFGWPQWQYLVGEECRAAREDVAIFDQSTFGKLLIQGRDAASYLQRVCAGNMDLSPGILAYTPILNSRGGYESDAVVMRINDDDYMLITGASQPVRDRHILRKSIESDEFVTVADVTSGHAVLSVMGPKSRKLLKRISPDAFDNESFPLMTHQLVEVGGVNVRAVRISYVGELGWELHVPTEAAVPLYDALFEAGSDLGLRDAGTFALGALRLEKGYCSWGHDIGPDDTPLEAGMGFTTKLSTDIPFVGRQALERQKAAGIARRRIVLSVDDPDVILLGAEPIVMDGEIVGQTTSAAYSHTLGRSVAMGFMKTNGRKALEIGGNGKFEIEVAMERTTATAYLKAPFDPDGYRMRIDEGESP